ncbi:MAG: hypothetical protein MK212_09955, partial [Saprospiraceae bacterium]|nr:hypothetical protein [Saprospiraceae bacterium]
MNVEQYPRHTRFKKAAWFFIVLMISEICFPVAALALTSGPIQPEVQSFKPVSTTEMVDILSGDFSHNIPLFEVPGPDGGYPINLFYNSVTDPNVEASWVGLGWNINMGSLTRTMRGLPDDFNGELVKRKLDMLDNTTVVVGGKLGVEIGGYENKAGQDPKPKDNGVSGSLSLNVNYTYNSYKGGGFSLSPSTAATGSFGGASNGKFKPSLGLGLNLGTSEAASMNTNLSFSTTKDKIRNTFNFGLTFNGREGLSRMNLGYSMDRKRVTVFSGKIGETPYFFTSRGRTNGGLSASYSFARTSYTPEVKIPWTGFNISGNFGFTPGGAIVYAKWGLNGSFSIQQVKNGGTRQPMPAYGYNYLQNATNVQTVTDFNREKDGSVGRHQRFLATPSLSYDIYSVAGQGIGATYRSHRGDYGFTYDPSIFSSTGGLSTGAEVGAAWEVGADLTVNYSAEGNFRWPNVPNNYAFQQADFGNQFENFYYKAAGEAAAENTNTYDYMGGDDPLRLRIKKDMFFEYDKTNGGILEKEMPNPAYNGTTNTSPVLTPEVIKFDTDDSKREDRRPRNMNIQPITNNDLIDANGDEILPEYDVKHYDLNQINNYIGTNPSSDVQRNADDQNAGFSVTGVNGARWIYGLPIYNLEQKEATFSVAPQSCKKYVDVLEDSNGEINYKVDG